MWTFDSAPIEELSSLLIQNGFSVVECEDGEDGEDGLTIFDYSDSYHANAKKILDM